MLWGDNAWSTDEAPILAHRHGFGTLCSGRSQIHIMLLHDDHTLTIFAVFITTSKSQFTAEVTVGLSLLCAVTVAATLIVALRRDKK